MYLGIGTKIRIKDGSYMATQLKDGTIGHSSEAIPFIGRNRDVWTIILRNIALPTMVDSDFISYHNNILIKNDINGELWFCSFINIVEAE
jgi:hypothetical protein